VAGSRECNTHVSPSRDLRVNWGVLGRRFLRSTTRPTAQSPPAPRPSTTSRSATTASAITRLPTCLRAGPTSCPCPKITCSSWSITSTPLPPQTDWARTPPAQSGILSDPYVDHALIRAPRSTARRNEHSGPAHTIAMHIWALARALHRDALCARVDQRGAYPAHGAK
jgi:hypothetical protein